MLIPRRNFNVGVYCYAPFGRDASSIIDLKDKRDCSLVNCSRYGCVFNTNTCSVGTAGEQREPPRANFTRHARGPPRPEHHHHDRSAGKRAYGTSDCRPQGDDPLCSRNGVFNRIDGKLRIGLPVHSTTPRVAEIATTERQNTDR